MSSNITTDVIKTAFQSATGAYKNIMDYKNEKKELKEERKKEKQIEKEKQEQEKRIKTLEQQNQKLAMDLQLQQQNMKMTALQREVQDLKDKQNRRWF
jgi:polyhydroxyalkanoate synthesis regulator phasin